MIRAFVVAAVLTGCSQSPPQEAAKPAGLARSPAIDAAPIARADAAPTDAAVDAAPPIAIVDEPIRWSDERAQLTLDYRRRHSDAAAKDLDITPKAIVLHYTGGGSASDTRAYFDNTRIEARRKTLAAAGAVNVSSHYLVDRDGTIYRLQPETRFARHCIGLNHLAIGIENVGDEVRFKLTDAQITANAALVRELAHRFEITHLLGHHEVMAFRDHAYYVELETGYKNEKGDPGARFMLRVRELVEDLKLAGLDTSSRKQP